MDVNQDIVKLGELIHDALLRFVSEDHESPHEIYSRTLEGGCAVASAFLVRAIRNRLRVKADFVAAPSHAWVESGGIVYDPTAIQFDKYNAKDSERSPKVKTFLTSGLGEYPYSHPETRRINYINATWPRGQRPCSFVLDWTGLFPVFKWIGNKKRRAA